MLLNARMLEEQRGFQKKLVWIAGGFAIASALGGAFTGAYISRYLSSRPEQPPPQVIIQIPEPKTVAPETK